MGFWPNDIIVKQDNSPRDIMRRAGEELMASTGVLSVAIRETLLSDRLVLRFIVQNQTYSLEYNLFEASHRPNQSYPVVIEPPASDIPDFLKRERYIPGSPGLTAHSAVTMYLLGGSSGRTVKNEWVCATPAEFTEKLKELFALDYVKSNLVSLQAPAAVKAPAKGLSDSTEPPYSEEEDESEAEDEPPQE
jgi:hypothetical protein